MAWDALGNIFKKKDDQATGQVQDSYAPMGASGGGGASNNAPVAAPLTGFSGQGGSTGGPVSAGFVNFGTLYDQNKDKAAGMASNVYNQAQAAADKAKNDLQGARDTFNSQVQAGSGFNPIGGAHGTRIENKTTTPPSSIPAPFVAPTKQPTWNRPAGTESLAYPNGTHGSVYDQPINTADMGGAQAPIGLGSGLQGAVAKGEAAAAAARTSGAPGVTTAGASRYAGLYGQSTGMPSDWNPGMVPGVKDYHHSVSELEAKSAANQGYGGPDSLKGSMGDAGYSALQDELRKGEQGAQNLTTEGGIENALGYGPRGENGGSGTGNSAMDTGLTETAGRGQFKGLADRLKGLSGLLPLAQADSQRAVAGAKVQAGAAADNWDKLLKQYEADHAQDPNAPIIIGNANKGPTGFAYNDPLGPNGGVHNEKEGQAQSDFVPNTSSAGYQQVSQAGYSQQDINDIWDQLTPDEQAALTSTESLSGVFTGSNVTRATSILSVLQKLAAARAKKNGGA